MVASGTVGEIGSQFREILAERAEPFDALVTDLLMPGMNGHEMAMRLRMAWPDLRPWLVGRPRKTSTAEVGWNHATDPVAARPDS